MNDRLTTGFRTHLLTESRTTLARRVASVLTGLEELERDADNLGSRQISRSAQHAVNGIRAILHGPLDPNTLGQLETLQAVAVHLMKTMDSGDGADSLRAAVKDACANVKKLVAGLGRPISDI